MRCTKCGYDSNGYFCTNCGYDSNGYFCTNCGEKLEKIYEI